jgi:hypothetical protein
LTNFTSNGDKRETDFVAGDERSTSTSDSDESWTEDDGEITDTRGWVETDEEELVDLTVLLMSTNAVPTFSRGRTTVIQNEDMDCSCECTTLNALRMTRPFDAFSTMSHLNTHPCTPLQAR